MSASTQHSNRMTTVLDNVRLLHPGEGVVEGSITFSEGRITAVTPAHSTGAKSAAGDRSREHAEASAASPEIIRIDGGKRLLTPGLMDVHTHGIHRSFYEQSGTALREGLEVLPRYGTTSVCPTLYRIMEPAEFPKLDEVAQALEGATAVHSPGFHLEGPFLKLPGAGAACLDGDLVLLDEILAAARNRVAAMSISPDTPRILPVIERLRELDIVPFITHTRADYEQTKAAIEAGARHATHFYDVFLPPEPTDGGVRAVGSVEALLEDPRCSVDFIADGVHVHPGAIRLALRCKGWRGVVLITDSNVGAGLPEGDYETPWGFPIHVAAGKGARVCDPASPKYGGLAGSALTMDEGINNLLRWLDLPEHEIWAMGTANPARLLGLENSKGTLHAGADADCVLWEPQQHGYRPVSTWVAGRQVWTDPQA